MATQQDLEQLEISMDEARKTVALRDALRRLTENKDWKEVVDEHFFRNEASRLVLLKADQEMQTPENQAAIDRQILTIGGFRSMLRTIFQLGNMAEQAITADENTREAILAEGLDVD
jgi:hypothetical protein